MSIYSVDKAFLTNSIFQSIHKTLLMSIYVPSSQIFINITDRSLDNMTTFFDPHLDHLKANSIHKQSIISILIER